MYILAMSRQNWLWERTTVFISHGDGSSFNMLYVHRIPEKKIAYFYILEASPRPFSIVITMIYIAVVPLLISYILITQYPVHTRVHLCQSYRFLCSDRLLHCFINKFFIFGNGRMNVISVYIYTSIIFAWTMYGFLSNVFR